MNLHRRATQPELMDDLSLATDELRQNLDELADLPREPVGEALLHDRGEGGGHRRSVPRRGAGGRGWPRHHGR